MAHQIQVSTGGQVGERRLVRIKPSEFESFDLWVSLTWNSFPDATEGRLAVSPSRGGLWGLAVTVPAAGNVPMCHVPLRAGPHP